MGKIKFRLNGPGVAQMLQSREAQAAVDGAAKGLAERAGEGFKVHSSTTSRARAYVRAGTRKAGLEQTRKHVLERVYGGGSG